MGNGRTWKVVRCGTPEDGTQLYRDLIIARNRLGPGTSRQLEVKGQWLQTNIRNDVLTETVEACELKYNVSIMRYDRRMAIHKDLKGWPNSPAPGARLPAVPSEETIERSRAKAGLPVVHSAPQKAGDETNGVVYTPEMVRLMIDAAVEAYQRGFQAALDM